MKIPQIIKKLFKPAVYLFAIFGCCVFLAILAAFINSEFIHKPKPLAYSEAIKNIKFQQESFFSKNNYFLESPNQFKDLSLTGKVFCLTINKTGKDALNLEKQCTKTPKKFQKRILDLILYQDWLDYNKDYKAYVFHLEDNANEIKIEWVSHNKDFQHDFIETGFSEEKLNAHKKILFYKLPSILTKNCRLKTAIQIMALEKPSGIHYHIGFPNDCPGCIEGTFYFEIQEGEISTLAKVRVFKRPTTKTWDLNGMARLTKGPCEFKTTL